MTEQEITQARADLEKLGIEQLRCGVMLQLLKIEALTKERDAALLSKDKFFDESVKHRQERDALTLGIDQWRVDYHELRLERDTLAAAAKLALKALCRINDAPLHLDHGERMSLAKAIVAIRQGGVEMSLLPLPTEKRLSWGYTAEQMQTYGQQCREQALLDAMNKTLPFSKTGAVIAAAIRSLK